MRGSRSSGTSSLQQLGQRRVVEQRARPRPAPARDHPADRQHRQPARAAADHAERIGAVDLLGVEVLATPARGASTARVEVVGAAGQRRGVDGAGRGADDDRKRVAARRAAFAPHSRDRPQHAHLIGGARAASGEDQAGGDSGRVAGRAWARLWRRARRASIGSALRARRKRAPAVVRRAGPPARPCPRRACAAGLSRRRACPCRACACVGRASSSSRW